MEAYSIKNPIDIELWNILQFPSAEQKAMKTNSKFLRKEVGVA